MKQRSFAVYDTAWGPVTVGCGENAVTQLHFGRRHCEGQEEKTALSDEVIRQLEEYLRGARRRFDLPLAPEGTSFQRSVWQALREIPYGQTRCYEEIAEAVGNPRACRAVGMANNKNPIAILIPCHRVVGKNGSLVGYAGGLELKKKLLRLEQETCPEEPERLGSV